MTDTEIRHIVIVGNGAAGAVVAASVAFSLRGSDIRITLVQSASETMKAPIEVSRGGAQGFHQLLGIDESVLTDKANGAIRLGTRYRGFRSDGRDVFVPLGGHGMTLRLVDFHHYVAKLRAEGSEEDYNAYSLPAMTAATGHFAVQDSGEDAVLKTVVYDICVDPGRYASFMLERATEGGVTVSEAAVESVKFADDGTVEALVLNDGNRVYGDFFIDCSDDRSVCSHLSAAKDFQDWSDYLPCDRVASLRVRTLVSPDLFTSIDAHDNGWLRRTMLGDTTVSSFVYSSQYTGDDFATQFLEENIHGAAAGDVQVATQSTGTYCEHWIKNCVAIGPAAATLEPMEIESMHLLHNSILRLLTMLPRTRISAMLSTEYNRVTNQEIECARDYQVLRYALTDRKKGPFWENLRALPIPNALQDRIDLFKHHGRMTRRDYEYPGKARWISSFVNFGFWPSSYDPLADMIDEQRMRDDLSKFKEDVQRAAEA